MATGPKTLSSPDLNGLKIVNLANGVATTDAATKSQVDAAQAYGASLANRGATTTDHTAINDFDTQVRTSRLDQLATPVAPVAFGSQKITGLLDPTNPQEGATKAYVDAQTSATASGLVLKGSVRAATNVNVSVTAAPATIDSLTPVAGEIYFLMGQTAAAENGPRIWNAAGAAMPRAANWNTSAQATIGSFWDVREGTNADTFVLLVTTGAITLDTTSLAFVVRGGAVAAGGYTTTSPVVAAGTTWTVTHSLNTKWILAQVARVASPFDLVDVRIERATVNTISVMPDVAMASGEYEVMVYKVS